MINLSWYESGEIFCLIQLQNNYLKEYQYLKLTKI